MISKLFKKGIEKAGSQETLGEILNIPQQHVSAYKNYKPSKRKPNDTLILKLADYIGADKGEVLYKAKLELDPDNADLWKWCARRESNPRPSASEAVIIFVQYILFLVRVSSLEEQPYRHCQGDMGV